MDSPAQAGPRPPDTDTDTAAPADQVIARRCRRFGRHTLWAALAGHTLLLAVFGWYGVESMAALNAASLGLFAVCLILDARRRRRAAAWLARGGVLIHAVAATALVGPDSGFGYHILLLSPLLFIDPEDPPRVKRTLAVMAVALYLTLDVWRFGAPPPVRLDGELIVFLRLFNAGLCFLGLGLLASFYARTVLEAEQHLHRLATVDGLTGLLNRRSLTESVTGDDRPDGPSTVAGSVVLIDVDQFRAINDAHGQASGDQILKDLAGLISELVRPSDQVARWGGGEFLLYLPDCPPEIAQRVAERIRSSVCAGPMRAGPREITVSVTCGIAERRPGEDFDACVARADIALGRGKQDGRNRCERAPAAEEPQAG